MWVLCKDRLPPTNRRFDLIVADKYGDVYADAFYDVNAKTFKIRCHDECGHEWWWSNYEDIVAWMHLPRFHAEDYEDELEGYDDNE